MPATQDQINSIGPRYDCGIFSPTFGWMPFFLRPQTYRRKQQLLKRDDVIAALQQITADRDLDFWTRSTQAAWNGETSTVIVGGQGFRVFTDPSSFDTSQGIDNHVAGAISAVAAQVQLASDTTGPVYRGGVVCPAAVGAAAAAFFGWLQGKYIYTANINAAAPTFLTANTDGANGKVLDIATDGATIYFALDVQGIWKTTAAAPGALTRYDAGANGPYHRIVWDPLRKKLFGITAPSVGARLEQINSGAAPTVIYDFVNGRLDAIANVAGYIFVGWNTGDAVTPSAGRSVIYRYDGTNVTEEHSVGDGGQIVGLFNSFGGMRMGFINDDPHNDALDAIAGSNFQLQNVNVGGSLNITGNLLDGYVLQEGGTKSPLSSMTVALVSAGSPRSPAGTFYVAAGGIVWRFDLTYASLSRSFGNPLITVGGTQYKANITGLVLAQGKIIALVELLNAVTLAQSGGVIVQLSGSANGNQPTSANDDRLIGSRMDGGLPYVPKYWYAHEVIVDAIPAGASVEVYYSLDDGATWVQCGGSPFAPAAGTRLTALIQQPNNHVKYAVRPLPNPAGGPSPVIHAVSARYAVQNPSASAWEFTVTAYDLIRGRGTEVEDSYGQDLKDFLFNISHQPETVTFYDVDDPNRTPHTCWVRQLEASKANTSGEYKPLRWEGDIPLVLWEVAS